jgi:HD-like signal output (HDOD) protein
MGQNSILLAVSDPQTLIDITQALGAEWEACSVANEADAFEQLGKRSFDALLVDFNLGSPDASELVNQVLEKRPETIQFLLAYEADLALIAAKVLGSHQILPKPIEIASLKSRIEKGLHDSNGDPSASQPTAPADTAPVVIPSVYSEVISALDSTDVSSEQIGEIISRDAALTTEVLRLTRSSYLGLPSNITEPAEAVESLGLDAVRALATALRFLAEHSHLNPGYLSLHQIWQHSTNVAQIARDLVLFETNDRTLASQAMAAGLLHDLGKVVLVTNFDDLYGRVHSLARNQPVPLWEVEKEMFGANHGEIGGCLVGMWNMPSPIVEATALHHEPPVGEQDQLTPLAAVHIANVLEHQLRPSEEFRVAPVINTAFLNDLGLLQRLPIWRATYGTQRGAAQSSRSETSEPPLSRQAGSRPERTPASRTANQLAGPAGTTRTTTSGQANDDLEATIPAPRFRSSRWVYAGVAAGILFLLALWFRMQPDLDDSAPVYARVATRNPIPADAPASPAQEEAPPAEAQATSTTAVPEPVATPSAVSEPEPASVTVVPEPPPAAVSQEAPPAPAPSIAPHPNPAPDFKLSGIIYGVTRPSAIVNGKTVYVGDQVSGATIISIRQSEVTLQFNGQRRTCKLP